MTAFPVPLLAGDAAAEGGARQRQRGRDRWRFGARTGAAIRAAGSSTRRCPGGGATMDHTVHVTDLMRWILQDEVREVYAEISNGISHARVRRCRLSQPDLSARASSARWTPPGRARKSFPTWGDVTLEVITERGTLSMDMFAQNLVLYSDRTDSVSWHNWGGNMDDGLVAPSPRRSRRRSRPHHRRRRPARRRSRPRRLPLG